MATAQLNVRIDADLKAAGDLVLERLGVSAVKVVRDAWQYIADHQKLPDYSKLAENKVAASRHSNDEQVALAADYGEGLAVRLAREAGIRADFETMTYAELRESAYEEMLAEEAEGLA